MSQPLAGESPFQSALDTLKDTSRQLSCQRFSDVVDFLFELLAILSIVFSVTFVARTRNYIIVFKAL